MDNYYLEITIFAALFFDIVAGVKVVLSDYFEKPQKIAQVIIILLIPFIASIGIILLLRSVDSPIVASKDKANSGHGSTDVSSWD